MVLTPSQNSCKDGENFQSFWRASARVRAPVSLGGYYGRARLRRSAKSTCFDLAQSRVTWPSTIHSMFEMVISPKRGRWEWMVCDRTGKVIVSGCELSRSRARHQAARALFQLLLTNTSISNPPRTH